MSSNIEDIPFIDDLLDHIKSVEGKNYGAYNPDLYTDEDKKDEVSLRDAVRRNTLFYKNTKNPDSKANQQIYSLATVSKPLTRMVALDAHLRGNTNALNTLQSFLDVDVDYDIGPKTIAAATEYVKSDPTLQEFFDHQRATYRDNPDAAFKEVYNDADQREFLAINRNISHKNRKLFDLHSQVLRSQNNFKPFMENGTTTTVRISGVQNKEDGLHYNVPTYDPYNQKIIDPTTPEGYKELDTLIKTLGGWDQFPSFENPMEGDLAAKRLKKYINADAMYYKNTGKKEGGFINMQEGGDVENTEQTGFLAPSLTSKVLPDETVDTSPSYKSPRTVPSINTDEGFYASNPAPGETMDEFIRRTTRYIPLNENQIESQEYIRLNENQVESQWLRPIKFLEQTSYTPPEDYVSPRISNPFGSVFGYDGDSTGDFTDPNRFPTIPDPSDDFITEKAIIETFGTYSDAMVAYNASKNLHGKNFNAWAGEIYGYINQGVGVDEALTIANNKNYYPDTLTLEEKRTQYALDKAYGYIDEDGNVSERFTDSEGNTLPADTEKENRWDSVENWFEELGKKTLYTSPDQTFNLTIGNIADDAFVALMTEFFTGDTEKALIAGAGSFTATNVTEMAVNKVWAAGIPDNLKETFNGWLDKGYTFEESAALAFNRDGTEAGKAAFEELSGHARNMNALMSSTATMLTSFALGADMEQVLLDGASTAAIALGTDVVGTKLLETFGQKAIEDYASSTIAGVGGGTLSALVALIRTGDIKQAAISGLAGGLLAAGNPLGWAVMGVQLLMGLGKKPSNKSGYASFDFDKFEINQYSQGDYDPSKANDDNVEFSRSLMEPLIPYLKSLEESTGFDFKGDLQIHYSEASQQGIYYTLSDIKQEGLTAEQMFLNRLDYFEGRDQSTQDGGRVYRRRFEATEQGIADMYEAIMADLQYIAENQMSDIKYFTGIKKSQEQIQQEFKDSGFDIRTFRGIKQGGKISLDKGGNVQYNKGNYGLVNKKDKAPPSARADDVPMTLKEGDFVLSQPAVALYGKDTIDRMLSRAATDAGKNLKSGGKVPVNVHNGEYIIPKNLTKYIGSNVLETMNNRGLMSVGERPNT